jgi:hypothetical protein
MNQYIRKFVVAVAMTLAVSGVAQAKEDDDGGKGCSNATLRGLYVFNPSGFNIVGGVPQPKTILEFIDFNGDGTFTGPPGGGSSINGVIGQNTTSGQGTYTVQPDCTGNLLFGPPTPPFAFNLIAAFKGSVVYMIQTGPGAPVMQGSAERVSR